MVLLGRIWNRIKNVTLDYWRGGIRDLVVNRRLGKAVIDLALMVGWFFTAAFYPIPMVTDLLGISFATSVLSRMFTLESSMASDFINPFIIIGVFTFSTFLWNWYRDVIMVISFFVIPRITQDFKERVSHYYTELTPIGALR